MVRALPDDRRRYEVLDGELYVSTYSVPKRFRQALSRAVPYV